MAFNPFDFFRRNQKAFFAVLTIVCMFVFILQFGQGDFFTSLSNSMNIQRQTGPVITTLYGKNVHESDISRAQYHRQLASEFLFSTLWVNQNRVAPPQQTPLGGATLVPAAAENIRKIDGILGVTAKEVVEKAFERGRKFGQIQTPQEQRDNDFAVRTDLDRLRNAMLFDRTSEGKSAYQNLDAALRGALDDMVLYLQFELYRTAPGSNFGDLFRGLIANPGSNKIYYMGGGRTTEELLDFMIWKNQADKLGISPNDATVLRLALAYSGTKSIPTAAGAIFADNQTVKDFLGRRPASERPEVSELTDALRSEVRVALAREAMNGRLPAGTFPAIALSLLAATPGQASLGEAYEDFLKQTTTADFALLEVPVASFFDKVTTVPTDTELQRLFDKYKKDEPNPEQGRPGFKEPRRAQVQYLHIAGTSSFIQQKANLAREIGEFYLPMGMAATMFNPTGSTPFALVASHRAMDPSSVLAAAHALRVERNNTLDSWLTDENGMHETSWMRMKVSDSGGGVMPVVIGQLMAGMADQAGPLTALNGAMAKTSIYEAKDRDYYHGAITPAILPGIVPHGVLFSNLALGVLQKQAELPDAWGVGLKTITPMLRKEQVDRLSSSIRGGLMRDAYDQVKKLRDKPGKDSQQALDKFLKDRGIESALKSTPYTEDVFELRTDPTVLDLSRICDRAQSFSQPKPNGMQLALSLAFSSRGVYDPLRWGPQYELHRLLGARQGQGNPNAVEEYAGDRVLSEPDAVIAWRSEDTREAREVARLDDEVPATLETFQKTGKTRVTMREKVLAAWKLLQAQALAEKRAREIRDELRAKKGKEAIEATMQTMREQKLELKEWQGAGRLLRVQTPTQTDPTFAPGEVPLNIIGKPRSDTMDLMMGSAKEVGDAVLVPDAPLKNWYVVLCQRRTVPTENAYFLAMKSVALPINRMYYSAHQVPAEDREYDQAVITRLRQDACKDENRIDSKGRWIIPNNLRTTFDRATSDFGGDF